MHYAKYTNSFGNLYNLCHIVLHNYVYLIWTSYLSNANKQKLNNKDVFRIKFYRLCAIASGEAKCYYNLDK